MTMSNANKITLPCIINNEPIETSKTFDVIDPADRKTISHHVSAFGMEQMDKLMKSSQTGFEVWRDTPFSERRKLFAKVQTLLNERLQEIIQCESTETTAGKGFAEYDASVLAAGSLDETMACMSTALRGELAPLDSSGKRMLVVREPIGPTLSIVPWNAPSTLCMRAIVNPLAAGCSVVLKTSEYSPKTHSMIAKLFIDAGLPKGVLNVIHVATEDAGEMTKALIEHPVIRKINFTGSTRVGRMIAQTCAVNLKPVVLELGGKAPVIVCEDADLDLAANNIIFGGLMNQGQICMSSSSIIVHKDVQQELGKKLGKLMEEHKNLFNAQATTNQPMSPNVQDHRIRGLFTVSAVERVKEIYDQAVSQGGKVIAGTSEFDQSLGVVQPAFVEANTKMRLYQEELFAPILGIYPFTNDEEAIELANEPGAGLTSSIFSKNETRAFQIARKIQSGAVHINGMTVHDDQTVPHGGVRTSGMGRFNGIDGIREYTFQKTITFSPGIQYPFFAI